MTTDVEGFSIPLNRPDDTVTEEVYEVGLPRLLDLYARHDIQSTFYFTGMIWLARYARVRRTIRNELLVGKLEVLVARLKATRGARIFKRGFEKAVALLGNGERIFVWAPSLRDWLKEPDYLFWLGAGGLRIGS